MDDEPFGEGEAHGNEDQRQTYDRQQNVTDKNYDVDPPDGPFTEKATVTMKGVVDDVADQKEGGENQGRQHEVTMDFPVLFPDEGKSGEEAQS